MYHICSFGFAVSESSQIKLRQGRAEENSVFQFSKQGNRNYSWLFELCDGINVKTLIHMIKTFEVSEKEILTVTRPGDICTVNRRCSGPSSPSAQHSLMS